MPFTSQDPSVIDSHWMDAALLQARRGIGFTSPNPPVGAVIVKDGAVIGAGYHRKAGEPHAEVEAIKDAMQSHPQLIPGSTLYVTLEPCCTVGRTGPCTEAIIAARIGRVVYGATDPNPAHQGQADEVLQAAGISVTAGVQAAACEEILRPFSKWIRTGLPYVIAKVGQSLDGRITRPAGEPSWITSDSARAHARRIRTRVDAIIIGAETLRRDDPLLTLRDADLGQGKLQPWRVVLTRSGALPAEAQLFTDEFRDRTLVMRDMDFTQVLEQLGQRDVLSVLVEGGGIIHSQAFAARQVDEVIWYIAPRICGGGRASIAGMPLGASVALQNVSLLPIGDNICITGYPQYVE
jgi:diaminohydroxyphosphoribosylaminopyrimidine deaminase/5-amino-6-(5-phosphoribosylamino)uracil reductase